MTRIAQRACVALVFIAWVAGQCLGHETDQYTLPQGRKFANLADHFNKWAFEILEAAATEMNGEIRGCLERRCDAEQLAELQSHDTIAKAVFDETIPAYFLIEGMEIDFYFTDMANEYPGELLAYKEQFTNIYQHVHFFLDPRQLFRIWHASTFRVNDVLLGSDKIGHFTDMGMNYYRAYSEALKAGKTKDEAMAAAVEVGTHGILFSERGAVGYLSAGAYSNGDMASNYLGFKFYLNLTEPIMLNGTMHPPMLVRDGEYWKLAPHVRRDSDFFSAFICQHYNEALNPSLFENGMRKSVRKALEERTEQILNRYVDVNGNRQSQQYFEDVIASMRTYYGEDYGYNGPAEELVTIANVCFEPFPETDDMGVRNKQGLTALHDAAARGDTARIARLLDAGADVNIQIRSAETYSPQWGDTPLHSAAHAGQTDAAIMLIERGADVRARNIRGATPMHMAIAHPGMIELLMKKGADVNARDAHGRTPLHWAAAAAQTPGAEVLLEASADVNARNANGETALFDAVRHNNVDMVELLLAHEADPSAAEMFKSTPLHVACALRRSQIVEALLKNGAQVSAVDIHKWTPLHDAARRGSMECVALMLDAHATVDAKDTDGCTPLQIAARHGWNEAVQELLAAGADPGVRNAAGQTAVHEAAFSGRADVVTAVLARASGPLPTDDHGRTPYDVAKSRGHAEVAAILKSSSNGIALGTK